MRKTKIVCTMGPSTDKPGILRQLMENGMNVARFNFSHGDYEEHKGRYDKVRALSKELDLPIACMLDTKGPEIRLGEFKNGVEMLEAGQTFTLTTREVEGTKEICSITYKDLPQDVHEGGTIMLDDGLIKLAIKSVTDTDIVCEVLNSGKIKTKKGVNVPGVHLSMPYMSQRDTSDILFGVEQGFDLISASFARNAQDIMDIRHILDEHNSKIRIIAKIENQEGIDNIDEILTVADGIMVARGDMGVEIDFAEIPAIQKHLIDRAMSAGKICITATQMLDSMIRNPRPTRAEVADVANAIYDGTDAIMLSGETAAGKYPIEAVTMMGEIAEQTERYLKFEDYRDGKALEGKLNVSAAVGSAAVSMVEHIKAACIVTPTMSGQTARLISNLRPSVPIYGVTPYEWARRKMQLYWGVRPVTGYEEDSTENIISHAMYMVRREELVERGDMVIFTAGDPATNEVTGEGYMTNMLHIIQAK